MGKKDLALNNLQWLTCHKPNQTKLLSCIYKRDFRVKICKKKRQPENTFDRI